MPKKRTREEVAGQYFRWLVWQRDDTYYADGRSNPINVGRHSLATNDRGEALENLKSLDLKQAVAHGLANLSALGDHPTPLGLEDGRKRYEEHLGRDRVMYGVKPASRKRYRAVMDKFLAFAKSRGVRSWNQVDAGLLQKYGTHLEQEDYAYATKYLELTCVKQIVGWLTKAGHLVGAKPIVLPLRKPEGTTTYCWRLEEVQAMVAHCRAHPELQWLEAVIVALSCTGLRIGELASLRWTDLDANPGVIHLTDESRAPRRGRTGRETKSGRSRSLPVYPELQTVLNNLKRFDDGVVFHGPLGGRLKPDVVRTVFIRDVLTPRGSKFPSPVGADGFADGRLHSFRHYFCSTCAIGGTPMQVVMDWLGHRESKMVRHYFHLHDAESRRQIQRLNFLGGRAGGVAGRGASG